MIEKQLSNAKNKAQGDGENENAEKSRRLLTKLFSGAILGFWLFLRAGFRVFAHFCPGLWVLVLPKSPLFQNITGHTYTKFTNPGLCPGQIDAR